MNVTTLFGIPLSVSPGGLAMDADRLYSHVKALDGSKDKPIQFMLNSGAISSALEHSVPEQMFSTPDNPAQGISAVKALQLANDQGIPIFTIDQSNISTILPQVQLDSGTIADIQSAVNAGKEVTVSKTDITFNGWTGCGYIVIDPVTGAGAYMISGGMNGAMILALYFMSNPSLLISVLFLWLVADNVKTMLGTLVEMIKIGLCAPNPVFMYAGNYLICKAFYGEQAAIEYYKCLYDIVLGEAAEAIVDETITLTLIASLGLEVGKKIAKRISVAINMVSAVDDIISYGKCNYKLVQ